MARASFCVRVSWSCEFFCVRLSCVRVWCVRVWRVRVWCVRVWCASFLRSFRTSRVRTGCGHHVHTARAGAPAPAGGLAGTVGLLAAGTPATTAAVPSGGGAAVLAACTALRPSCWWVCWSSCSCSFCWCSSIRGRGGSEPHLVSIGGETTILLLFASVSGARVSRAPRRQRLVGTAPPRYGSRGQNAPSERPKMGPGE